MWPRCQGALLTGDTKPNFFSVKAFWIFERFCFLLRYATIRLLYIELIFFLAYLFRNPFWIAKKKADDNIYGETPLSLIALIALEAGLKSGQTYLELGSGRSKSCFFLEELVGCTAIGIDHVMEFMAKGARIKRWLKKDLVKLYYADLLDAPFEKADLIYMYGTCFSDRLIQEILKRLKTAKAGAQIVTVSYALVEYDPLHFETIKTFAVQFPWGESYLYFNRLKLLQVETHPKANCFKSTKTL